MTRLRVAADAETDTTEILDALETKAGARQWLRAMPSAFAMRSRA